MFYLSALMYWALELCFPLFFERPLYDFFVDYGHTAQDIFLGICALSALHSTNKFKCCIFVMVVHSIFSGLFYSFDMYSTIVLSTSVFFFAMWAHVVRRPPLPKRLSVDDRNIVLAFYTGNNGSFLMNLFQTMSDPVSSMCVLSGKYCLKLKKGENFKFTESHGFFRDWENKYYLLDTGVKSTNGFIEKMRECGNMKARWFGLRISCIIKIRDLLGSIGKEWRPQGILELNPSVYFRKAYKLSAYFRP